MQVIWVQNMLVFVVVWFLFSRSPKTGKWGKKVWHQEHSWIKSLCIKWAESKNNSIIQTSMMYSDREIVTTPFCLLLRPIFRIHYTRQISYMTNYTWPLLYTLTNQHGPLPCFSCSVTMFPRVSDVSSMLADSITAARSLTSAGVQ